MKQIERIPDHCYLTSETVFNVDGTTEQVLRAKPETVSNIVTVKQLGGMTSVNLHCIGVAKGVNTHEIHDYNVATGYLPDDDDTIVKRAAESKRVSVSRLRSTVRELVTCNPWDYFVTITLRPDLWDRDNPENLQKAIRDDFRRWARKRINRQLPYGDCAYLLIPELHENGGVHIHGFIHSVPPEEIIAYTADDVSATTPLPFYICSQVMSGHEIYHLRLWDNKYGYNTIIPIRDRDRAANYATKYITKSPGAEVFKTRLWHSRGLTRPKPAAKFQISSDEMESFRVEMNQIAAITKDGKTFQSEYYQPGNTSGQAPVAGINTMVDRDTMSTEDVIAYLEMEYLRIL